MTTTFSPDLLEILLVEDNPVDVKVIQEAFKEAQIASHITVVTDGEAALEYLNRTGKHRDATQPGLILLDLNLPKKDGRQILEEIKSDSALKTIPVVVLTSSDEADDIKHAYEHMASCYVQKPLEFDEFMTVIVRLRDFWLSSVKPPET